MNEKWGSFATVPAGRIYILRDRFQLSVYVADAYLVFFSPVWKSRESSEGVSSVRATRLTLYAIVLHFGSLIVEFLNFFFRFFEVS